MTEFLELIKVVWMVVSSVATIALTIILFKIRDTKGWRSKLETDVSAANDKADEAEANAKTYAKEKYEEMRGRLEQLANQIPTLRQDLKDEMHRNQLETLKELGRIGAEIIEQIGNIRTDNAERFATKAELQSLEARLSRDGGT